MRIFFISLVLVGIVICAWSQSRSQRAPQVRTGNSYMLPAAMPMWRCFSAEADLTPFHSLPANIDLDEKNIAWNELAKRSAGLDFTREDRIPENEFNEILWKGIRGMDARLPPPRRAAFVKE